MLKVLGISEPDVAILPQLVHRQLPDSLEMGVQACDTASFSGSLALTENAEHATFPEAAEEGVCEDIVVVEDDEGGIIEAEVTCEVLGRAALLCFPISGNRGRMATAARMTCLAVTKACLSTPSCS